MSYHSHNERDRTRAVVERILRGEVSERWGDSRRACATIGDTHPLPPLNDALPAVLPRRPSLLSQTRACLGSPTQDTSLCRPLWRLASK